MAVSAQNQEILGNELPGRSAGQLVASIPLRTVLDLAGAGAWVHLPNNADARCITAVTCVSTHEPMGQLSQHLLMVTVGAGAKAAHLLAEAADRGVTAVVLSGVPAFGHAVLKSVAAAHDLALLLTDPDSAHGLRADVLGLLLGEQIALLARIDDVHRMIEQNVLSGGTLDELAGRLVLLLDGPVMVTTTDGRVLAGSGPQFELDQARAQQCFDRTGRLVVERERFGISAPRGPASCRAMVRIVAANVDLGRLVAFSGRRALTEQDMHILERAATVAALAITRAQAVSAVESKYRAEFLRDALAGRAGPPSEVRAHAHSLGWNIDRPLVVVVAEPDEDDQPTARSSDEIHLRQEGFTRAWSRAVGLVDPRTPVAGFSQEVVTLLPVPDGANRDLVVRQVGDLVRVIHGDGGGGRRTFCTGISRPVRSPADLPQAYHEALDGVSVGRQMHGRSALTHFDDMGIYRLLTLIPDSAALQRFVAETLKGLATDDHPENAEQRQTLSTLIDSNLNVAESARLLFVHYNTLRYRIGKLERMLGPFTTDVELRLAIALALRIQRMRGL